jgi:hypothetical protein
VTALTDEHFYKQAAAINRLATSFQLLQRPTATVILFFNDQHKADSSMKR